jgi:hypothetical protein
MKILSRTVVSCANMFRSELDWRRLDC